MGWPANGHRGAADPATRRNADSRSAPAGRRTSRSCRFSHHGLESFRPGARSRRDLWARSEGFRVRVAGSVRAALAGTGERGLSEFLQVRCGMHRFLVPSADIDSIEVLKGAAEPFGGRRAPREWLLLDGRVLAGDDAGETVEHGVALCATEDTPLETRIVVDQVGALVHCDPSAIEPMPHAV